jgi:secreted PhoX family phosphatase
VLFIFFSLSACNDDDDDDQSIVFEGIQVPTTDAEKRIVAASPSVKINGKSHDIGFHTLMRSGDIIGNSVLGLIYDENGEAVVENDGSQFISNDNDFSSLLPKENRLFNVTHFESRPGAMYLTELRQDANTGLLSPLTTENIDFSDWGGLWVPCAGSVTPWGTHLGSEEYPPNARAVEEAQTPDDIDDYYKPMLRYFGITDPFADTVTINEIKRKFKPYLYGYPVEINVTADGGYTVNKRMAMRRLAVELAYVMPDNKTVYISDDGENVGLFLFIADQANNLTAGNLYAAKWIQTSADNGGFADIEWISLGHAAQSEIRTAAKTTKFSDIFQTAEPNTDGSCPAGYTSINAYNGDGAAHECLKLKPGMAKIASRLETRRYAAMLGATVEFRKEEGVTYDPDGKVLYVAMSEVTRGMENYQKNCKESDKYDKGGPNHIKLPCNECGCVYGMDVAKDTAIGSDYVAHNMYAVVCGIAKEYEETSPYANNTCDVDNIANPDNLTFIRGYKTLIIGEDTGSGHQNDAIWSYNIEKSELTRIETTPYGSETTSPYHYPNINGWSYIMSTVQHPYGESDSDKLENPSDAKAYFGYIGPMPAMD